MPQRLKPLIEGYAIISEDGMLANAQGIMPESLKFEADQRFFANGLDKTEVVVHGRHSHEHQPHSHLRSRIIVTNRMAATAPDPGDDKALFWNPKGASFEEALSALNVPVQRVGIIGGTGVFGMFLDSYDAFYLSHAPGVRLPGGRPVFPGVPAKTPEEILKEHGLYLARLEVLDRDQGLTLASWLRK